HTSWTPVDQEHVMRLVDTMLGHLERAYAQQEEQEERPTAPVTPRVVDETPDTRELFLLLSQAGGVGNVVPVVLLPSLEDAMLLGTMLATRALGRAVAEGLRWQTDGRAAVLEAPGQGHRWMVSGLTPTTLRALGPVLQAWEGTTPQ
ncbi:MAG: hypothetical protein Q8S13_03755, partial [Dehalococcoidia bacterium]|nr:hypothetical protein [Dehalococcoidia bacterium]